MMRNCAKVNALRYLSLLSSLCLSMSLVTACGQKSTSFVEKGNRLSNISESSSWSGQNADATAQKIPPNGEDSTLGDKKTVDLPSGAFVAKPTNVGVEPYFQKPGLEPFIQLGQIGSEPFHLQPGSEPLTHAPVLAGQEGGLVLPTPSPSNSSGTGEEGPIVLPPLETREMIFSAQTIAKGSVTRTLDSAYLSSDLVLLRNYPDRHESATQIVRAQLVDTFEQGNLGAAETQIFEQIANRPLDIVVVIDNSGSMAEEQGNMASKLSPLLSYVKDADWQIGVVTTDPDQGCLRRLIKKSDANPAQLFSQAVTAGINGSGNERGVLQAVRALAGTCLPQPWLRPDSTVAVLIVSDEDNCSSGGDCPGKDYAKANYLFDYLSSIRQPGKNARVYALIWHPSQAHTQCSTAGNQAPIYADLVARTSGTWGSICASDYTSILGQMSQDIKVVLNSKFTLSYVPVPTSVRVFIGANEITSGITVTGKVIELSPPPPEGASLTINYRHDPTPIKSIFTLRHPPDAATVSVTMDSGSPIPTSAYNVNVAAAAIEFFQAPAEYAAIAVRYTRGDPALTQSFRLAQPAKSGFSGDLEVKINGVITHAYTFADNSVNFFIAPPDGALIDFAYKQIGNPVLRYPFHPAYETPHDLEAFDRLTNAAVPISIEPGFVSFGIGDFVEGRQIYLRYDNIARQSFEVELPVMPLPGETTATGGSVQCSDAAALVVNGRYVLIDGCGFADDIAEVRIDYSYIAEDRLEFVFSGDHLPGPNEFQQWKVWVNGIARADFTRSGYKFTFGSSLGSGAIVKVQLIQEQVVTN